MKIDKDNIMEDIKEIMINGCIDVSENPLSADEFCDKFIEWIESKGWYFGSEIRPYTKEENL